MRALIATIVLLLAAAAGIYRLNPPAEDDSDGFNTAAAMKHLKAIAQKPHPVGSPANAAVRQYVFQQLQSLGFETQIQSGSATYKAMTWPVKNVIARLRGTANLRGAIMLSAHFDSVQPGPGAGDDGAAVAAMLEVAHLLAQHPPKRDVIFLITDSEETGLNGAELYVKSGPWRDDVALDFNFDARGTSGPSTMFQTSSNNGWLVENYAQVSPHPITTSMAGEVYHRMPNGTDFQVLTQHGYSGLNFAFIGDYVNYHTVRDDLDHLSEASLRHTGMQMLAMAKRFANVDRIENSTSDDVYFDVLGFGVINYPARFALPLSAIGAAVGLIGLLIAWRAQHLSLAGGLVGFVSTIIGLAVCIAAVWGVTRLFDPRRVAAQFGFVYGGEVLLVALIASLLIGLLNRWLRPNSFAAGAVLLWLSLGVLTALKAPGGSYLFLIPLIFSGIAMACLAMTRGAVRFLIPLLCCAIFVALNAGHMYLAALGLTLEGAHVSIVLPALFIWLIVPIMFAACSTPPIQTVAVQDLQLLQQRLRPANP